MDDTTLPRNLVTAGSTPVERTYFAWNDAVAHNDADALLSLYAEDAVFESPLVPHLLGIERGYLDGRKGIRPLFDILAIRKPPARQYFRTGYLTDGKRLIWEYPRDTGDGEQMDFVEAMDLNDSGLIQRHCAIGVGSASACSSATPTAETRPPRFPAAVQEQ
jgi:hypothetical protein